MKRLKCEICESTEFIKQEGVFVCQNCGCKYSIEETKKMMIERTVDVPLSMIKSDSNQRLQNLYILARRAKEDDNAVDAAHYYNEIRVEDPNSWEAAFYAVYYAAMDIRIAQIASAARSVTKCLDSVIGLIKNYVPQEEQESCYMEVASSILMLSDLYLDNSWNNFREISGKYSIDDTPNSVYDDWRARSRASVNLMATVAVLIDTYFDDFITAKLITEQSIEICETLPFYARPDGFEKLEELKNQFDQKMHLLKEIKKNEYWAEHTEEKIKLEKRLSEIENLLTPLIERKTSLTKKKDALNEHENQNTPAEKELNSLSLKITSLKYQYDSLGIFSGKRKKAIQAELDSLALQKAKLKELAKKQRAQIHKDIQQEIEQIDKQLAPINAQIESLKAEEQVITDELNKDR